MNKTTIKKLAVFKSERFRNPTELERSLGLWVDRIGAGKDSKRPEGLRILGLYAAVEVVSGAGVYVGKTAGEVSVGGGDVMLLFPDEPAMYYPQGEWQTRWIVWSGHLPESLEECDYFGKSCPVVRGAGVIVEEAFMPLLGMMEREDRVAVLSRGSILMQMLAKLYERCVVSDGQHGDEWLRGAMAAAMADKGTTVVELAKSCGMSQTHFRRVFKSRVGMSPKSFLISRKIAEAKELLSQSVPIKDVAATLGFKDEFHFMRTFKKVTGGTAGTFQRGVFR